jgi:glycine cleavage system H protein
MKVNGYDVPENLLYNKEHAWILEKDGRITVGITDYAQKTLKEITYLYLPNKGKFVNIFEVFGTVESIKAISELYSPFTGTIVEINEKLRKNPKILNQNPYDQGWIIIIQPIQPQQERNKLITAAQYAAYIQELIVIDENLLIYRWKKPVF